MNIAIIGGTQGIGLELAMQSLEAGHTVTVLARHPEKMPFQHDSLRLIKGDATKAADVESAVAGQDAVVSTIGTGPTRKPVTIFSQGARNIVAAVRKSGKKPLLVNVTGIGTGDSRGHGGFLYDRVVQPLLLNTTYRDKDREENVLKESGLNWIIVRPGFLTKKPRTGKYRVLTDLNKVKARKISRADVADFILQQLEKPEYLGKTPLVTS